MRGTYTNHSAAHTHLTSWKRLATSLSVVRKLRKAPGPSETQADGAAFDALGHTRRQSCRRRRLMYREQRLKSADALSRNRCGGGLPRRQPLSWDCARFSGSRSSISRRTRRCTAAVPMSSHQSCTVEDSRSIGPWDDIQVNRYHVAEDLRQGRFDAVVVGDIWNQFGWVMQNIPWLSGKDRRAPRWQRQGITVSEFAKA